MPRMQDQLPIFVFSTLHSQVGTPTQYAVLADKGDIPISLWETTYSLWELQTCKPPSAVVATFLAELAQASDIVSISFSPYGLSFTLREESRLADTLHCVLCAFAGYLDWTAQGDIYVQCLEGNTVGMEALAALTMTSWSSGRFCNFIVSVC